MLRRTLPAGLAVMLLAGCAGPDVPASKVPDPPPATTTVEAALEPFHGQDLDWAGCGDDLECATLTVPVDHAEPDGPTIGLSVARLPSTGDPRGSLVTNPGGPGVSGVDHLRSVAGTWSRDVRAAYDVVSFDPRGVGSSEPVVCLDDDATDELLGSDPTPDDPAEQARVDALQAGFVDGCVRAAGELLGHLSTVDVARDLDVLRGALGDDRLNYLGQSYGGYLGTVYADLFPGRVGRMVLDSPLSPTVDLAGLSRAQADGLDEATRAWAATCVDDGCPLGDDVDTVAAGLHGLLDDLDGSPLPVVGEGPPGGLGEGWATWGVAAGLVSPSRWDQLTSAVGDAVAGDGSGLWSMATGYVSRTPEGYRGNMVHALHVVNCLDREPGARTDDATGWEARLGTGPCTQWPVDRVVVEPAGEVDQPVLVVGSTSDPVTPLAWAQETVEHVGGPSVLLTREGNGHVAYRRDRCVTRAVDAWLVEGMLPAEGARCG